MKLSNKVLSVLRNYAKINQSLIVDEKEYLKTISTTGDLIALHKLDEEFPILFNIWDLNMFLGILSIFDIDKTEFEFKKFLEIKGEHQTLKYAFCERNLIPGFESLRPAEFYLKFDKFDTSFKLSESNLKKLVKASNYMNLEEMLIQSKGGNIVINLKSSEDVLKHVFTLNIPKDDIEKVEDGEITIKMGLLNIINGDYTLSYLNNKIMKLSHNDINQIYFGKASIS